MQKVIRIGTRSSELALWQANKVSEELTNLGCKTKIVPIDSIGDHVQNKPLYELGITGIFTKNLDIALLNEEIDIAVHSLKDVPTVLPKGIVQVAVLKRGNYGDILVLKDNEEFFGQEDAVIATGSLRRKAQWLDRYPTHKVVDIRGNVNTRLKKVKDNAWNGAIFAKAGLERIGQKPKTAVDLSWMVPAPAQGAVMVAALAENKEVVEVCKQLNHEETAITTGIERKFLNILEGGCTAPIGALAYIDKKREEVKLKGILLKRDGTKKIEAVRTATFGKHDNLAKDCAGYIINKGGKKLMLEDSLQDEDKEFNLCSTKKLSEVQKKLLVNTITVSDNDFIQTRFNRLSAKLFKDEIENVIITSKNGVNAILNSVDPEELQFKNIYCVGRRTKRLIEDQIGKVTFAARNAQKLSEHLMEDKSIKEVTYFCSNIRLDVLPKNLASNGIEVNEIEAYKTIYTPEKVTADVQGVLFYSPSTVESFIKANKANTIAFCIGESTAKEAKKHFSEVQVAKVPTIESVLELVNAHFVK